MRIIPKKSSLTTMVWKTFTFIDILVILVLLGIAGAIILSNLPAKWYLLGAFVLVSVIAFLPDGDERAYKDIAYVIRYAFSHKHYAVVNKPNKSVDALVPKVKLGDDGVLDYGNYVGAVLELNSVAFGLKSEYQQNCTITALSKLFGFLSLDERAQIVKVDRPINFNPIAERTYSKLVATENSDDTVKLNVLKSRLEQIDLLNNVELQYRPYYYLMLYALTRDSLETLVSQAWAQLSVAGLEPRMLGRRDVAVFLKYCYTRRFDEREIDELAPEQYDEWIKPQHIDFSMTSSRTDGEYSFTYAIADYPLTVGNAWGSALFNIDNTRVVLNIRPVESDRAKKRIDNAIREIGTRSTATKASEIIERDTHLETLGVTLTNISNENERLLDCELTVTGYLDGEKSIKEITAFRRNVRQQIVTGGFRTNSLRFRQLDGFISSSITRRATLKSFARGINSESLAASFPFVHTSVIEPDGMTLGLSEGYPFIFDPFKHDADKFGYVPTGEFVNGNMFIAGTSGSGKSFFAKTLLTSLYSENTQIFILDPENEYRYLCQNVGGNFIDVGTATTGRINPFHIYQMLSDLEDENGEPIPAPPQAVWSAHLQYLDTFFAMTLPGIKQDALEELNDLVVKCYNAASINEDTDCAKFKPSDFPTFDDLYKLVERELKSERNAMRTENLQRVKRYISKFTAGGRFANLWNGPSTLNDTDRFTVFNFQSLFESKNNATSNGQMLTVLRFLEQQIINMREHNIGKPADEKLRPIVVLDEGYMFIDENNPTSLDFIKVWFKRIRKYAGSMIFLTQNLADIVGNAAIISKTSAIINNAQYSFIFTLQGKDIEVLQDVFAARNLTEAELEEIQRTDKPKGTAFFMGSATQRAVVNIIASDTAVELFSSYIDFHSEPPEAPPAPPVLPPLEALESSRGVSVIA